MGIEVHSASPQTIKKFDFRHGAELCVVSFALAVLGLAVLGGVEGNDRPAASSISTGMTEERDGLISEIGA